jgi:hypothetical protein
MCFEQFRRCLQPGTGRNRSGSAHPFRAGRISDDGRTRFIDVSSFLQTGDAGCGAFDCGEPASDPDFNTAHRMLLPYIDRLNHCHASHSLKNDPPR